MTAGELRDALLGIPSDAIVILQKDVEGNGYSPAVGANPGFYIPYNTWSGEFYEPETDDEDEWYGDNIVRAVVLWPVN